MKSGNADLCWCVVRITKRLRIITIRFPFKNMTVSIKSNHIFIMHPIFYSKISKLHSKIHLPASFLLCENIRPLKNENQIAAHNLFEHSKSEKLSLCQLLHCYLLVWAILKLWH